MRRRIEVLAFERRRVVLRPAAADCPVCLTPVEMLTTRQAAALAQVEVRSVRRWLAEGRAHGARTPGGQHRVCRNSLFLPTDSARINSALPDNSAGQDARPLNPTEKENSHETQADQLQHSTLHLDHPDAFRVGEHGERAGPRTDRG